MTESEEQKIIESETTELTKSQKKPKSNKIFSRLEMLCIFMSSLSFGLTIGLILNTVLIQYLNDELISTRAVVSNTQRELTQVNLELNNFLEKELKINPKYQKLVLLKMNDTAILFDGDFFISTRGFLFEKAPFKVKVMVTLGSPNLYNFDIDESVGYETTYEGEKSNFNVRIMSISTDTNSAKFLVTRTDKQKP
ncbi:MAG TPA: hypothetical protein DD379_14485 [Cyanobacteria bacterium UBA11162]|nr:hypothetical protein [Cyanobacteria bacterium UBA11162]